MKQTRAQLEMELASTRVQLKREELKRLYAERMALQASIQANQLQLQQVNQAIPALEAALQEKKNAS